MLTLRKSLVVAAAATAILLAAAPVQASTPSGERMVGNLAKGHGAAIEPAYDHNTGDLTYLLMPHGSALPVEGQRACHRAAVRRGLPV